MPEAYTSTVSTASSAPFNAASTSSEIMHAVDQFQIAQGYFSDILTAQTAIFSVIVGAIIALYFFFNSKVSKEQIENAANEHFAEVKKEMEGMVNEKMETLENMFEVGMAQNEAAIGILTGQNYLTLGQFWDSEEDYNVAFIWWLRGAHQFSKISEDKLARICLSGAKSSLERIRYGSDLRTDDIGEYQKLTVEIPDSYKIEKDLLDTAFKETLTRKFTPPTSATPTITP